MSLRRPIQPTVVLLARSVHCCCLYKQTVHGNVGDRVTTLTRGALVLQVEDVGFEQVYSRELRVFLALMNRGSWFSWIQAHIVFNRIFITRIIIERGLRIAVGVDELFGGQRCHMRMQPRRWFVASAITCVSVQPTLTTLSWVTNCR